MINKVILVSHPLREYGDYGSAWPSKMFEYYLQKVTDLETKILVPPNFITSGIEDNFIFFDYVKFFKFYGIEYNRLKWGELFYHHGYNKEAYEYVEKIFKDSLVIAYEMEDSLLYILDELKIPYINMYISPVRFLEDQMFCLTTNNEHIYYKLLEYKLADEQIYLQANYIKTYYCLKDCKKIQKIPTALFIGQTQYDRSLINPQTGEIYTILDHKLEFENALKGYKKILYKKHPKASDDDAMLNYLKTLADVEITTENFYSLISRPDIKKVVAISSGGLNEAKYFGKEIEYLLHSSVNLQNENNFDKEKYINIYEHTWSLHFWADILSPILKTIDFPQNLGFYNSPNKLRNSRGHRDYWGYDDFNQEATIEKIQQTSFMQNDKNSSNNIQNILRLLYHLTNNKTFLKMKFN